MKTLLLSLVAACVLLAGQAAAAAAPTVSKTAALYSDPVNGLNTLLAAKNIPGAVVDYDILVKNPNTIGTMPAAVVVTDNITTIASQGAQYYVGLAGASPFTYTEGVAILQPASNLTCGFISLSSTSDCVAFSNDNGATWTYVPSPDAQGYDSAVTNMRFTMSSGNFGALGAFNIRVRVRIK